MQPNKWLMKKLSIKEAFTEDDIKLLTVEEFYLKAALKGISILDIFNFINESLEKDYIKLYKDSIFKQNLTNLITQHAVNVTPKEMSSIVNHTLGEIILKDALLREEKEPGIFKPY